MSFNRLKEIGQELAVVALSLGDGDEAKDFMLSNAFTALQCQRFQWGVGIVNAVTASWLVTTCVQNRDQAESIINSMYSTYRNAIREVTFRIGDFVPLEEEKQFIRVQMMSASKEYVGNVEDTQTNAFTLTELLYDRRQQQYFRDLGEGLKEAMSSDERPSRHILGSMFYVAKRFVAHFVGNEDDASLVVGLSLLFGHFLLVLMNYCDQNIRKNFLSKL